MLLSLVASELRKLESVTSRVLRVRSERVARGADESA